jgi:hypothetical protein
MKRLFKESSWKPRFVFAYGSALREILEER